MRRKGRQKNGLVDVRPAERNGDDQPNPHPRYALPRVTWTYYYAVDDTYSRIDYILLSRGMAKEWDPAGTYVLALANWGVASDHRPIVATFEAADKCPPAAGYLTTINDARRTGIARQLSQAGIILLRL